MPSAADGHAERIAEQVPGAAHSDANGLAFAIDVAVNHGFARCANPIRVTSPIRVARSLAIDRLLLRRLGDAGAVALVIRPRRSERLAERECGGGYSVVGGDGDCGVGIVLGDTHSHGDGDSRI